MSEKTFKRQVLQSLTLGRGDKRIELTTGMTFEFTKEELDAIEASAPDAISNKAQVDLDSGDVVLTSTESTQKSNETNGPDTTATLTAAEKKAAKKAADEKAAADAKSAKKNEEL